MSRVRVFVSVGSGERLDRFLADRCLDLSRTRIKRLIADGEVSVDGRSTNAGFRLRSGQAVTVNIPEPAQSHLVAQSIPISVVHEDEHMFVVDKPPGMPVHPGIGHPDSTLVNALLGLDRQIGSVGGTIRPGLVHRLDMDTSGLMVVAKTDHAHAALSQQFKDRSVHKGYLALAAGRVEPPAAIIEAPIGRDPDSRRKMAIVEDGRQATSKYSTLRLFRDTTYLDVRPRTGRTHQIRVHLASIGHPLVGDAIYGRPDTRLDRHFLHAANLEFEHPGSGDRVQFECALPDDLAAVLNNQPS